MVSLDQARRVVAQFQIEAPFTVEPFEGRGNINLDTLLVTAGPDQKAYLLQRVNPRVFPKTDRVMAGMIASIQAQQHSLQRGLAANTGWQVPELVPTHDGEMSFEHHGTWRMMRYIEGTVSYKSLSELSHDQRLKAAYEVGRGLAIYSDLTSHIDPATVPTALPGYRNTRVYFDQFESAMEGCREVHETEHRMPGEPEVRAAAERHFLVTVSEEERISRRHDPELAPFIDLAVKYRPLALAMQDERECGSMRTTAIHGDTKIENFLFDARTGTVVALVDLDTIMPLHWLADWGDMVRSLVNVAGEKERDLGRVDVDHDVYASVTEGFLSEAKTATPHEVALMPRAVQVIALELGVRFLADYLRGDTYFQLGPNDPHDLNKVRAMVQLRLFERLLEHEPRASALVPRNGFAVIETSDVRVAQ